MAVELSLPDQALVRAFVQAEATDFGTKSAEWLENFEAGNMSMIRRRLAEAKAAKVVVLTSLSNMGMVVRQLTLSPSKGWDWKADSLGITLCPCGRPECGE